MQAELTITDVCTACNSGFLSQLDEYGAELWDKFLGHIPQPGEAIRFEYDFDLLVRWLLKLAYNAGRVRKSRWPPAILAYLAARAAYIRGDEPRPTNLYLYLQLIPSTPLTPEQKQSFLEEEGLEQAVPSRFRRVAPFVMRAQTGELNLRAYLVAINAYHFYLAFWKPDLSRQRMRDSERKFLRKTWGAKRLRPDASRSVLYPSSVTIGEFIKGHPLMHSHAMGAADWLRGKDSI